MTSYSGGCHCGAVRYEARGDPLHHALCHCGDCRRHAGAPAVAWIAFTAGNVHVTRGAPVIYASSTDGRRHFCGDCGTGLFYINDAMLPGLVDIQSSTMDDAATLTPAAQIQVAERLNWMTQLGSIPAFDRFPGPG